LQMKLGLRRQKAVELQVDDDKSPVEHAHVALSYGPHKRMGTHVMHLPPCTVYREYRGSVLRRAGALLAEQGARVDGRARCAPR
jgi:hypothetical protein